MNQFGENVFWETHVDMQKLSNRRIELGSLRICSKLTVGKYFSDSSTEMKY